MMRPLDNHPHVTKGLQGSQGIFTLEETLDFGSPLGKRAEHDRTVRDGLVARNPDTALDATTRLGKKDQIVVMHGVHIGPTGQDFTEMFTGYPGTGKHPEQVMTITLGNGFAQSIQVIAEGVQGAQYGITVGNEDVVPHHRVTAGNTGKVSEASRGIAEDLQVFAALGQRINQGKGQHVRQMTGGCQYLVMVLDIHVFDIGTQLAPQQVDARQRRSIRLRQRGQDHFVATKQIGLGRLHPTLFGTGNRMSRHQARQAPLQHTTRGTHHAALGTAHIGQHRITEVQLR